MEFSEPGDLFCAIAGREGIAPMIDLIFAVDDPREWHKQNFERYRSHYAGLGHLGPSAVATMQGTLGGKMWYNALVRLYDAYHSLHSAGKSPQSWPVRPFIIQVPECPLFRFHAGPSTSWMHCPCI